MCYYKSFGKIDLEVYTDAIGCVYVGIDAEGCSENVSIDKEISKDDLKLMIDKLTEMYEVMED